MCYTKIEYLKHIYITKKIKKFFLFFLFFFFQAEDGIRDFCLSRGLGDVYKRQVITIVFFDSLWIKTNKGMTRALINEINLFVEVYNLSLIHI